MLKDSTLTIWVACECLNRLRHYKTDFKFMCVSILVYIWYLQQIYTFSLKILKALYCKANLINLPDM